MTIYIDLGDVAILFLYILSTLHKHTTRATAGVVERTIIRLYKGSYQLYNIVRSIEFSLLFGGIDCKRLEEVFIDPSYEILLLPKDLVRNLIDLIHHLFDDTFLQIYSSK